MTNYRMYIGGQWVDAASGQVLESLNPYTARPWATIPRAGQIDVARAVSAAQAAFDSGPWRTMSAGSRARLLRHLGDLLARDAERLARIETIDNGKLISDTLGQCRSLPDYFHYFAGLADKIEGRVVPIDKPRMFAYTRREPLGVCAAITPWNSPLLLAVWKLAPGLAAGNTFVIKPSEYTSATTLELAKLIEEAGFPPGVVNVVTGLGAEAGAALVEDPRVAMISFTGGPEGGRRISETAAKGARRLTMELGGKSPNIVFDDANLDDAVKGVAAGIFAATGQMCTAGSRLLVHERIQDEFLGRLIDFVRSVRMGNPMDETTQMGPVTTRPQFHRILEYIDIARAEGADCVLGGCAASRPECGDGWFVEPTIFRNVHNGMRIAREEVFGPVLACIPFKDDEEAIAIANDSPFGLAAGVWTQDMDRIFRMTDRLQCGTVWVNTYRAGSPLMPAGGYKGSGFGRENGREAIDEYLQTKSVWISTGEVASPFVMR
jgi:acyl-CoA reductase-like NAD-dependent aldehyde dehydrogenase